MIRADRAVEFLAVTADAILGRTCEPVVGVTLSALRLDVGSEQRKLGGGVVIERGALPLRGDVARGAIFREAGRSVVRRLRVVVVRHVAGLAGGREIRKAIVDVALRADCLGVSAGEGKACRRMVEAGAFPLVGGMAKRAVLRESRRAVVGIGGFLERVAMTGRAVGGRTSEAVIGVTRIAFGFDVSAGELEGAQIMVELGALPAGGGVASLAVERELACLVVGIRRLIVIRQVAVRTDLGCSCEFTSDVTTGARGGGVGSGQCESRLRGVVEFSALPGLVGMTGLAFVRESG